MTTRKPEPPVSSRTLRRTERRLETQLQGLRHLIAAIQVRPLPDPTPELLSINRVVDEQLRAFRSEVGERLTELERLMTSLVDGYGLPLIPRWSEEQRAAFRAGMSLKPRTQADGRPWDNTPGAANLVRTV